MKWLRQKVVKQLTAVFQAACGLAFRLLEDITTRKTVAICLKRRYNDNRF